MSKLCLVAAVATNGVIGRNNSLPWNLPTDLRWFKTLTKGSTIIMGRNTWDSLPRRPLPARYNVIVSTVMKQADHDVQDTCIAVNFEKALISAQRAADVYGHENIFVIGGAALYNAAIDVVDEMYITHVDAAPSGDIYFPFDFAQVEQHWNTEFTGASSVDGVDEFPFVVNKYTRK